MWGVSDAEAPDFRLLCRPYFSCYAASWCGAQAGNPCSSCSVPGNRQPGHLDWNTGDATSRLRRASVHSGRTTEQ